jgi:hypothetical protein
MTQSNIDTLFAGMATAPMRGAGGNYMTPGLYTVEMTNIKEFSGQKGRAAIFEFKVVTTDNDKHPVGSSGSYVILLENPDPVKRGYAWSDLKAIMFALDGKDPKRVKPAEVDPQAHADVTELTKLVLNEEYCKAKGLEPGFLNGTRVELECRTKKTRPTPQKPQGGDYTLHVWGPAKQAEEAA